MFVNLNILTTFQFVFFNWFLWGRLEVIWGHLSSFEVRITMWIVVKISIFSFFFVRLLVLILYGESIFMSFLYHCKVLDDKPNWLTISDCFNFGFSFLTLIKSAIRFSFFCLDNKLASRLLVFCICCKKKVLV